MEQLTMVIIGKWIEESSCRLCSEKATWLDSSSGYCDKCFPHYLEMGIDRNKFLKKKRKKNDK